MVDEQILPPKLNPLQGWSCRCGYCGQLWRDQFPTQVAAETFLAGHQLSCPSSRHLPEDDRPW